MKYPVFPQAGNKFLCTQMTPIIKIDADFFLFFISHKGTKVTKELSFPKDSFVSFVPL